MGGLLSIYVHEELFDSTFRTSFFFIVVKAYFTMVVKAVGVEFKVKKMYGWSDSQIAIRWFC